MRCRGVHKMERGKREGERPGSFPPPSRPHFSSSGLSARKGKKGRSASFVIANLTF